MFITEILELFDEKLIRNDGTTFFPSNIFHDIFLTVLNYNFNEVRFEDDLN